MVVRCDTVPATSAAAASRSYTVLYVWHLQVLHGFTVDTACDIRRELKNLTSTEQKYEFYEFYIFFNNSRFYEC